MGVHTYRLLLSGLGNVGTSFLALLDSQAELLARRYNMACVVTGAADSGGAAFAAEGLDRAALLALKRAGQSVAALPGVGHPGMSSQELVQQAPADVLLEATLTNLEHGQPGLDTIRLALGRGMHVVSANKGPLVLAYAELAALAAQPAGPQLRFSACVGGALPSINIGQRDLAGTRIQRVEAVLNGTTQLILRMMEQQNCSFAEALHEAQRRGIAEADPTLDIAGLDAANKLVILANAVLHQPTTLADVSVTGIDALETTDLTDALHRKHRIVLLCLAEPEGDGFRLSVRPTPLSLEHPLGRMSGDEMGIVYHTDIAGRCAVTNAERGPLPTAAAMLRDLLAIVAS
jgi:homoserine dehydrogenase